MKLLGCLLATIAMTSATTREECNTASPMYYSFTNVYGNQPVDTVVHDSGHHGTQCFNEALKVYDDDGTVYAVIPFVWYLAKALTAPLLGHENHPDNPLAYGTSDPSPKKISLTIPTSTSITVCLEWGQHLAKYTMRSDVSVSWSSYITEQATHNVYKMKPGYDHEWKTCEINKYESGFANPTLVEEVVAGSGSAAASNYVCTVMQPGDSDRFMCQNNLVALYSLGVAQQYSHPEAGYVDSTDKMLFAFYRTQTQYTEVFLIDKFNCGQWTDTTLWENALEDITAWGAPDRVASELWSAATGLIGLPTAKEYTAYTAAGHPQICDGLEIEAPKTRDFLHGMNHCSRGQRVEVEVLGAASGAIGDPHLHFADGGTADFRGRNDTLYAMLDAPDFSFALRTRDSTFLLPKPRYIEGSFFTEAYWTVRTSKGRLLHIEFHAKEPGFRVTDVKGVVVSDHTGSVWKQYDEDDLRVYMKQSTLVVRAAGWETNVTRKPIYNHVSGPDLWRIDLTTRPLDSTGISANGISAWKVSAPHGIIGQSYDNDGIAVHGAIDAYTTTVARTRAMAEGAIEGKASDYELNDPTNQSFKFSRFHRPRGSAIAARRASKLAGAKETMPREVIIALSDDLVVS